MSVAALGMLAGPCCGHGGGSASPPAVSLCPRGAGLSPQAARTGLLQHLSLSQALKQTIVKPCWFAECVPTLQPPNHRAQALQRCGGSEFPPAPRAGSSWSLQAGGGGNPRGGRQQSELRRSESRCWGCEQCVLAQRRLHAVLPRLTSPTDLDRKFPLLSH